VRVKAATIPGISNSGRPPGYIPHVNETEPGILALVGHWAEDELDNHIRHTALLLGYFPYHTRWSLRSEGGFPDWILLGAHQTGQAPRLVVIEAKKQGLWPTPSRQSKRGRWSIGQAQWLLRWSKVPCAETYLFWPSDALADIATILQYGATADMACVRRLKAVLAAAEGGPDATPTAQGVAPKVPDPPVQA